MAERFIRNQIGTYSGGRFEQLPQDERSTKFAALVGKLRGATDDLANAKRRLEDAKFGVRAAELGVSNAERDYAKVRAEFDAFLPEVPKEPETVAVPVDG